MLWYTNDPVFDTLLLVALFIPPISLIALRFMRAPYGRFGFGDAWGSVNARLGWFLMELPATLFFWWFYLGGPRAGHLVPALFAAVWGIHYANRGFVFPWLMRTPKRGGSTFGLPVLATGMVVTALHGYFNGTFFARLGTHLEPHWLTDPRFGLGFGLLAAGMILNIHSDAVVRNLRTQEELDSGQKIYRIPRGGGFRFVTNPSYLGELVEWTGFAIMTWSLPGVFILLLSAANLVPRAIDNHRWYRARFQDYPPGRRILLPFIF